MPADPRRVAIPIIAILAALSLPLVVAAQTDGLQETSTSTFALRPQEQLVHVDITITLINRQETPLRRWGSVWTPATASNVKFSGKGVATETVSDGRGVTDSITFPALKRKARQRIRVSYDLVDDAFAGPDPTLVTNDYAHFCWGGEATDSGRVSAVLPPGWQSATAMEEVVVESTPEGTTLRAPSNDDPGSFYACTDAFTSDLGNRVYVAGPSGQVITMDSWGHDGDWEPAMSQVVGGQLRELERRIGTPMPFAELTIQEVARTNPLGSDSDLRPDLDLLLIDQDADIPGVGIVGLARTWFNRTTVADPWLSEGLALWSGLITDRISCPVAGAGSDAAAPNLADWQVRDGNQSAWDEDRYALQAATACTIVEQVAGALGSRNMVKVTTAIAESPEPADWTTWLDAIEVATPPALADPDDADSESPLLLAERLLIEYGIATAADIEDRATS